MTTSKLANLYSTFWNNYRTLLQKDAKVSISPQYASAFKIEELGDNEFNISAKIDMRRLRLRASKLNNNLVIRISSTTKCTFPLDGDSRISCSNVAISYYKELNASPKINLKLLKSLHYDYENNETSLQNHPVFHCQFVNAQVNGGSDFFGYSNLNIDDNGNEEYQEIRIPTANMDIISVLLSVAADHLASETFIKLLQFYDKDRWHEKFPHISHHKKIFSPGNCYRSRAWYIG